MPPTVLWIRHAESEANAGLPTPDAWTTPLTEAGWEQARRISGVFGRPQPGLIVQSCMTRSRQTAQVTSQRFPLTRVEEWPIQEFTFLSGQQYAGTTQAQREAGARAYWERMDPDYVDGPRAESFRQFMARVDATLERLRTAHTGGPVLVFTHGRFLRGVLLRLSEPMLPMEAMMARALEMMTSVSVPNGVIWEMTYRAPRWCVGCAEVGHLLEPEAA
jgi:broad specificity phosphatase PhoE